VPIYNIWKKRMQKARHSHMKAVPGNGTLQTVDSRHQPATDSEYRGLMMKAKKFGTHCDWECTKYRVFSSGVNWNVSPSFRTPCPGNWGAACPWTNSWQRGIMRQNGLPRNGCA